MRKKRSYPKKRGGPTTLRPGIDTLEAKETPAGKEETIEMDAEVVEPLPNAMFKVKLQTGQTILAYTSGKMRKFYIRILIGADGTIRERFEGPSAVDEVRDGIDRLFAAG